MYSTFCLTVPILDITDGLGRMPTRRKAVLFPKCCAPNVASRSVSAIYSTGNIKGNGVMCIVQEEGAQNDPAGALCAADNSTKFGGEGEIHPRPLHL